MAADPSALRSRRSVLAAALGGLGALVASRLANPNGEDPAEPNEIRIYTVFGATGQQWDHVYVAGAFYQAFLDQAPADGLRRLYVALTRAMQC